MADFPGIPSIPSNVEGWEYTFYTALKESVELLTGQRAEGEARAVLQADVDGNQVPNPEFFRVREPDMTNYLTGAINASSANPKLATQITELTRSVIQLSEQVRALRDAHNRLLSQIQDS